MNSQQLNYYIHDESDALRFKLAGSLSGDGVESIYQAWQTSLSITGNRRLIIDITLIVDADEHGRALLVAWHRSGARIIAASPDSGAVAKALPGEPVLAEPVPKTHPNQSWLQRLRGFVLGCPTAAQQAPIGRRNRHSSPTTGSRV
jgi:hypothetical protein